MGLEPTAIAALIGAGVGGLFGAFGQIVAERLRQGGQLRHQNRLMLQEAYVRALRQTDKMVGAATSMKFGVLFDDKPNIAQFDQVRTELARSMAEMPHVTATVQAVGSTYVAEGLIQMTAWDVESRYGLDDGWPYDARRNREAADLVVAWGEWTVDAIRSDLKVRDAQAPPGMPQKHSGPEHIGHRWE